MSSSIPIEIERHVNLRPFNTFGVPAVAAALVRVASDADVRRIVDHPELGLAPKLILGGGSNLLLSRDVKAVVIKVEVHGRRVLPPSPDGTGSTATTVVIEAGAGEHWHDLVAWSLAQGLPGLENLALIPGTVGASPVQNIGAYGVELRERFHSLDAVDLMTGRTITFDAAMCHFEYRDSVFKHALAGKSVITRVRFALPRAWIPVLGYLDLERKISESGNTSPSALQIFDWICAIRRAKLPDPAVIGNAGSFFKNPVVSETQCRDIIARDPEVVHYPMPDGTMKLAAGWLIDACGWKGKSIGQAGVYERHSLVLVNRGGASGAEIVTLARAIQESVYGRFGIRLEPEPVLV